MKKVISCLMAFIMLTTSLSLSAHAAEPNMRNSGLTDVAKMTKQEIADIIYARPLIDTLFEVEPVVHGPNYAPGKLADEAMNHGLWNLNFGRQLAGLKPVTLNPQESETSQHGAVLLSAHGTLNHTPPKPTDMSGAFYDKGFRSTSSSNIFYTSYLDPHTIASAVWLFMDDTDIHNMSRLGHRRWQLNPAMGKTSFGCAPGKDRGGYVTEYAFDASQPSNNYDFISWPASGVFPTNMIHNLSAWSVSLNPDQYQPPVQSDLTIKLEGGGKSWTFSGNSQYAVSNSGPYMNVNNDSYGIPNCIIFRPDGVTDYLGVYTVTIDGIKDKAGKPVDFSYQVDFFNPEAYNRDPAEHQHVWDNGVVTREPTDTQAGEKLFTCTICGQTRTEPIPVKIPVKYKVTIVDGYANSSGAGVYAPGDTVTLHAGTRDGYLFDGWTVSSGNVTLTHAHAETTSFIMPAAAVALTANWKPIEQGTPLPFQDVANDAWYRDFVEYVYTHKLMDGYSATVFGPGRKLTRAQLAQILYSKEGKPTITSASPFSDVDSNDWFYESVTWAASKGYVSGYGKGKFGPNDPITREQLATILYCYAGKPHASANLDSFTDSDSISSYARTPLMWAVANQVMRGRGKGILDPSGHATRAEVATMIMSYIEKVEKA